MQIVIGIPEEYYKTLHNIPDATSTVEMLLIKYGTPLPEHYGDLIDREAIKKRAMFVSGDNVAIEGIEVVTVGMIDNAPTIIPATKEGDGE